MVPESKAPAILVAALAVILVSVGAASIYADMQSGLDTGGAAGAVREVVPDISDADLDTLLASDVCAAYGRVEKGQNLLAVLQTAGPDLKPYFHPNGPIYCCGVTYPGCIEIFLTRGGANNHGTTDAIYRVIDSHGRDLGINNTPVIFALTPSATRGEEEQARQPTAT